MTTRWPVHPAPAPGEALSSWLNRIADRYGITPDVLAFDMHYTLDWPANLDLAPPQGFIEQLAVRTGVSVDQIRMMSISGFVPWLVEDLDPVPDAFATYTRQFSVLLPTGRRRDRTVFAWRAWMLSRSKPRRRACPRCVAGSTPPHPYHLMWTVPLMLSCPLHHCRLELHEGTPWCYFSWRDNPPVPREVSAEVRAMDERTWQALTTGGAELPRRRVHAGVWFRLLRTLIDELGATVAECGAAQRLIREVWERTGQPVRGGQVAWRPYEDLGLDVQQRTLEAAAAAIQMLENETLTGHGDEAALFLPDSDTSIDPGRPQQTSATAALWQKAMDSLQEAIDDAQHNPETARQLFNMTTYGHRDDEERLQRARAAFAELGIPREFLSH